MPPLTDIAAESTDLAPRTNLLDLDRVGLAAWLGELGEKRFRADQLFKWMHQYGVDDFAAMNNLGKPLRARLQALAEVRGPQVVHDAHSRDGTRKWVLGLDGGSAVEMVYIPESDRGTLCVSSQVGCQLNCDFCSTAQQGFNRNLTVAEIVGQVWLASRLLAEEPGAPRSITNVVMMGMGEPLLNFDAVTSAMNIMRDDFAYGLSRRRITLSTAGVVPQIDRLYDASPVSLAVSLHAPDDALRDRLVPLNRRYPIAELLAACRRYVAHEPRMRITFEYALLAGVNDSPAQARALARLLRDVPSKINLIPFNPFPGASYETPTPAAVDRFRDLLLERGLVTVTRRTRGDDIDGACGQLVGRVLPRVNPRRAALAGRLPA